MKVWLKRYYKKVIALGSDLLCLIAVLICRPLSEALLLHTNQTCIWSLTGLRCTTCGGTHFVHDLLSGRIGAAFADNQLLFVATVYLAVSLIALNLWLLFDLGFAKKILAWMYNIPTLIAWCAGVFAFLLLRNLPVLIDLLQML